MVVLAASICTKSGKPIISRQFREMPRSRIESLLTSFPKLIPANSQHTSVETADVRYVYQPLEDLYILLITNKASNILQDISTLHLFARVTSDLCRTAEEREILKNAFELLGAFDEIVSLGYRENVNLMQVRSVLEMESHEEKIQEIIARNKEAEAKEELKRRAKQLEMQRRDQARRQGSGTGNIGGGASGYSSVPRFDTPIETFRSTSPAPAPVKAPAFKGTGMKLGKKTKQADLMDALGTELNTPGQSLPTTPARVGTPVAKYTPDVVQESVHVTIREQLSVNLNQAGGLKSLSLKGELNLLISDPSHTKIRLTIPESARDAQEEYGDELQFKYHPNLLKGPMAEKGGLDDEIKQKDANRSWPVGQPLGVLRWKLASKDESFVPLSINCWPTPTGEGNVEVNIEYELESDRLTLHNLTISIPLPGGFPAVSSHSGSYSVDPQSNTLIWTIPKVSPSENKSGSLEFSIEGDDTAAFFPVKVDFAAEGSLVGVSIEGATTADGAPIDTFSREITCTTDDYLIV